MKKYKLLVDSPWGKKGETISVNDYGYVYCLNARQQMDVVLSQVNPHLYPDIFEEIKGPSDEEMVTNFINKYDIETIEEAGSRSWNIGLAKALLAKGFKAEWVKECEHDWLNENTKWQECFKCGAKK